MKIVQIIGCRPHLSKLVNITGKDFIIWTGQHRDKDMFIKDIKIDRTIPEDGIIKMAHYLRLYLQELLPDLVIVYGDTTSTLIGAQCAFDFNIPLAHLEAGVRLGDTERPEERIRIEVDSMSNYLFCVNEFHADNLREEGVNGKIFVVGDLLFDQYIKNRKHKEYGILTTFNLMGRINYLENSIIL